MEKRLKTHKRMANKRDIIRDEMCRNPVNKEAYVYNNPGGYLTFTCSKCGFESCFKMVDEIKGRILRCCSIIKS